MKSRMDFSYLRTLLPNSIITEDPLYQMFPLCECSIVDLFKQDHWTHPPFDAVKTDNGDIIARGSQDMKCCGIW